MIYIFKVEIQNPMKFSPQEWETKLSQWLSNKLRNVKATFLEEKAE